MQGHDALVAVCANPFIAIINLRSLSRDKCHIRECHSLSSILQKPLCFRLTVHWPGPLFRAIPTIVSVALPTEVFFHKYMIRSGFERRQKPSILARGALAE